MEMEFDIFGAIAHSLSDKRVQCTNCYAYVPDYDFCEDSEMCESCLVESCYE